MMVLFTNVFVELLMFIIFLVITVIFSFKWRYSFWERKGVVSITPSIPFGNGASYILQKENLGGMCEKFYKEFRAKGLRYGGVYIMLKPIFMTVDPLLIKHVMIKDFQHFINRLNYVNEKIDPLLSHNVFNAEARKWKILRPKLTPTFTSGKLKLMFPIVLDCSRELERVVGDLEIIDVKDIINRFAINVIGTCAFGLEVNCFEGVDSEFFKSSRRMLHISPLQSLKFFVALYVAPQFLKLFNISVSNTKNDAFFVKLVEDIVDYREKYKVSRNDFMQLLMQLKSNGTRDEINATDLEKGLTLIEITAQAYVFFLGGFETTANSLMSCLYELTGKIEFQDKLCDEINNVLGQHDNQLIFEALSEMNFMEKCLEETLRKYPVISVVTRECVSDYQVPETDVVLKKSTAVFVSIKGIHYDPEYYPNPEIFDPERFDEINKAKRPPCTFLPFGVGPRKCIGERFAMMVMKVGLSVLLKKLKFSLNSKTKLPLKMEPRSFSLTPQDKIWLNAKKISN